MGNRAARKILTISPQSGLLVLLLVVHLDCLVLGSASKGSLRPPRLPKHSPATMFKFNFAPPSDDEDAETGTAAVKTDMSTVEAPEDESDIPALPACEVTFDNTEEDMDEDAIEALFEPVHMKGDVVLLRCRPPESDSLGELGEVVERSDLTPGVYEGGLKLWEGSMDLVEFLVKHQVPLSGMRVMELGCGHALPGIYAAQQVPVAIIIAQFPAAIF